MGSKDAPQGPPTAVQDHYPQDAAQCFGCGAANAAGHQIKTRWADPEHRVSRTAITPRPEQTAMPGFVYGGFVASIIDCSGTGTAALALADERGIDILAEGAPRCVTGTLEVRYVAPTPMGPELLVEGEVQEVKGRKVTVALRVTAEGTEVATGRVVALEIPPSMASA